MSPETTKPNEQAGPASPRGRSLIAGSMSPPLEADVPALACRFTSIDPGTGRALPFDYIAASSEDVDRAAWQAWDAFHRLDDIPASRRADLLDAIADEIATLGGLIETASDETGLAPPRLVGERDRTTNTLRLFASVVRAGEWVQAVIDVGEPSRRPVAKPDLRKMLRPLGPVAVFGAGNFPLAYSTAGGDTASALAAGCPVIVKGHPGHPGTGELVARAVAAAITRTGMPAGMFSFLHSGGARERDVGVELINHRAIRAVGFTGSVAGGMAIARLASQRPDPIPVFAEMGSTNPVFLLPGALESQAPAIAERLAASLCNANGQMCTCPGLIFAPRGGDAERLIRAMTDHVERVAPQPMLSHRTRDEFIRRCAEVMGVRGVEVRGGSPMPGHRAAPTSGVGETGKPVNASPVLFKSNFDTFRKNPALHEEIFGPAAIIVVCDGPEQFVDCASAIHGSLTGTIWAGAPDAILARRVQMILEQRVGRLIYNGVPTGVEVSAAMVHGGPYPATNQPHTTAVGPGAIQRWCRPVSYQNTPEAYLPMELRNANPFGIRRLVGGSWSEGAILGRSRGTDEKPAQAAR